MRADDAVRAELRGADPAAPEHGQLHDVRRARRARRQQQHRVEGTLINYLTFLHMLLFLSSAVKLSIGSTIGFPNHGEGPY